MNTVKESFNKNVSHMFVVYWAILVIWQNISRIQARTTVDLIIKIGLLIYFSWFYIRKSKKLNAKFLIVYLLAFSLIFTAFNDESLTFSAIISYVYPIIFLTMVYGLGDSFEISLNHLLSFYDRIILITLYAALYAIIFCWDQFASAFFIHNAYGNELSSFFVSSHEYGLYLVAAIIACMMCLKYKAPMVRGKKFYYIIAIVILSVNLILTYSRTASFSLVIFLVLYIVLGKGKMKRWLIFITILVIAIILYVPELTEYFYNIVLKRNQLGQREQMYVYAIDYYLEGTLIDKLFGYGVNATKAVFVAEHGHDYVHNAYLQALLNFGIIGFSCLISFIISQILASFKLMKKDHFMGTINLGLCLTASAIMFTNTTLVFSSPIDSFFLTIFMFIVPKYVRNAIENDRFYQNSR